MANELTSSYSFSASKGGATEAVSGSVTATMTGINMNSSTVTFNGVSGAATAFPFGTVTQGGRMIIKNNGTASDQILEVLNATVAATVATVANTRLFAVGPGQTSEVLSTLGITYFGRCRAAATTCPVQITVIDE